MFLGYFWKKRIMESVVFRTPLGSATKRGLLAHDVLASTGGGGEKLGAEMARWQERVPLSSARTFPAFYRRRAGRPNRGKRGMRRAINRETRCDLELGSRVKKKKKLVSRRNHVTDIRGQSTWRSNVATGKVNRNRTRERIWGNDDGGEGGGSAYSN